MFGRSLIRSFIVEKQAPKLFASSKRSSLFYSAPNVTVLKHNLPCRFCQGRTCVRCRPNQHVIFHRFSSKTKSVEERKSIQQNTLDSQKANTVNILAKIQNCDYLKKDNASIYGPIVCDTQTYGSCTEDEKKRMYFQAVQDGLSLKYIPSSYHHYLCKTALLKNPREAYFLHKGVPIYNIFEKGELVQFCMDTIKNYPDGLKIVMDCFQQFRITQEICDSAVSCQPSCLEFVPDEFKHPVMCADAQFKCPSMEKYVPSNIKSVVNEIAKILTYVRASTIAPD